MNVRRCRAICHVIPCVKLSTLSSCSGLVPRFPCLRFSPSVIIRQKLKQDVFICFHLSRWNFMRQVIKDDSHYIVMKIYFHSMWLFNLSSSVKTNISAIRKVIDGMKLHSTSKCDIYLKCNTIIEPIYMYMYIIITTL